METENQANPTEIQEKDLKIQLLRELEDLPAWRLYQAHLEGLCRRKEVVKSAAVRSGNQLASVQQQFEIDGIRLAVSELSKYLTSLTSPQTEN